MRHETRVITVARDNAEDWEHEIRPREPGEFGLDLTNQKLKIGDGVTAFKDLPAFSTDAELNAAITATETLIGETADTLREERELMLEEVRNDLADKVEQLLEKIAALAASPCHPIGSIFPWPSNTPPAGALPCNGALVSRAAYPALWEFAQASGVIGYDSDWVSLASAGSVGYFSFGDGSTTFRLPWITDFIRGTGRGGRTAGSFQRDAMRSMYTPTAIMRRDIDVFLPPDSVSGPFYTGTQGGTGYTYQKIAAANDQTCLIYFNNGHLFDVADENRPNSVAYPYCVQAININI